MLGGRGQEGKEGRISSTVQDIIIGAVLDFAEASEVSKLCAKGAAKHSTRHIGHHRL